jgi:hypothetical protein
MKKLFVSIVFVFISITVNAQAPQGINYQSTVRNGAGDLMLNQSVSFRFAITLNSPTAVPVYTEMHTVTTDAIGQANCILGQGTPLIGTFSGINWGNGNYYLGVELNTASGFVSLGTSQLLSVPYALYANTTAMSANGFTHYIGELYGGGIVVSVWKSNNIEHGLIASLTNLSLEMQWISPSFQNTIIGPACQSSSDGISNTNTIVVLAGSGTDYAAGLCRAYNAGGYTDWYLPSEFELKQCYHSYAIVNEILGDTNGFQIVNYYSSSEVDANSIWVVNFAIGDGNHNSKSDIGAVRAVRKF